MLKRQILYDEAVAEIPFTLFDASYAGLAGAMRRLLKGGEDPDQKDAFEWTPLMYATYGGHSGAVAVLLAEGADTDVEVAGMTPLAWAQEKGHDDVAQVLRAAAERLSRRP